VARILIRDLDRRLGSHAVITGLNLEVYDKEFVTLLGPSGCGKTTTLRILAGFLKPDRGEIYVDGRLLSSPQTVVPPEKRRMGMVFQNYAIWPHMTVFENVAFGLRLARVSRAEIQRRVDEALRLVGLLGLDKRYPGQLSGGQQQRVALARSLVVEPEILLLDEPLSNLDAKLRDRMRVELKELQRRTGITFIYVTHDQSEALALSDRIVLLSNGILQQVGTPREIYEQPANLFVADFMGTINMLPGQVIGTTNGMARVAIANGSTLMATPRAGAVSDNTDVTLVIRPEAIRMTDVPPAGAENVLAGVVTEVTFLGGLMEYQVDVGGVRMRIQSDWAQVFPQGSSIFLTIPIAVCMVMEAEKHRAAAA